MSVITRCNHDTLFGRRCCICSGTAAPFSVLTSDVDVVTDRPISPPPFHLYNLYRRLPSQLRSPETTAAATKQSPDNQSSTAELNQQSVGTEAPGGEGQLHTLAQFPQQPQQFNAGPAQLQNFGGQPGPFNFGIGPQGYSQNISPQFAGVPNQGALAQQQQFPPFNFGTGAQLTNQFGLNQNANPLPITSAQQTAGQLAGTNGNSLQNQQLQGFGQFSGFQFPGPNFGQGFPPQLQASPGFPTGGFSNNSAQISAAAPSGGDQRSVVGFYGGAPNIGDYSFSGPGVQGQQQTLFPGPGGFLGPNFGQFPSGPSQLGSGTAAQLGSGAGPQIGSALAQFGTGPAQLGSGAAQFGTAAAQLGGGASQDGNAFPRFDFNPAAFQDGGAAQATSFISRVSSHQRAPQQRNNRPRQ
ncbi:hypothetical protein ANN_21638 [Periplaneta americana]|uniref:Uncharacterized protein n=1 Tax=Periplaneta americana TaxID=6978 RepID=A0ABQ8S6G3_PERAM|nr:hypothetical protein ANN_21638 [Periplaneta americana]